MVGIVALPGATAPGWVGGTAVAPVVGTVGEGVGGADVEVVEDGALVGFFAGTTGFLAGTTGFFAGGGARFNRTAALCETRVDDDNDTEAEPSTRTDGPPAIAGLGTTQLETDVTNTMVTATRR